jgi:hypothetical protein
MSFISFGMVHKILQKRNQLKKFFEGERYLKPVLQGRNSIQQNGIQ